MLLLPSHQVSIYVGMVEEEDGVVGRCPGISEISVCGRLVGQDSVLSWFDSDQEDVPGYEKKGLTHSQIRRKTEGIKAISEPNQVSARQRSSSDRRQAQDRCA